MADEDDVAAGAPGDDVAGPPRASMRSLPAPPRSVSACALQLVVAGAAEDAVGADRALLDEVDVITDATPANPNGCCDQVRRKAPRGNSADRVVQAK